MFSSAIERLNDRRNGAGESGVDAGFTLIELMVVLLILAILLAIAIPTFLGVTGGANDRAAQSNLNTALTTAKSAQTENGQTYTGIGLSGSTPQNLSLDEPSITWTDTTPSTSQKQVSVYVDATGGNGVILAAQSSNNKTCWFAIDNIATVTAPGTGTPYDATGVPLSAGTYYGSAPNDGTCDATAKASVQAVTNWGSHF